MLIAYIYLISLLIAPQVWLQPFVGLPIDYVIISVWFVVLLVTGRLKVEPINQDKFLLFFVVWMALSMVLNGRILSKGSAMGLMIVDYVRYLILYYLISATVSGTRRAKLFMTAFVVLAVLLSVEGIQHWMSGGLGWAGQKLSWIDPAARAAGIKGRTRWVGIFDGPGVFAVVYTVALPFLLAGVKRVFSFPVRIVSLVSLPLLLIALYFNGSRGGFLTALAIFVMYFGVSSKMGQRAKTSKIGVVIGAGIAVALFLVAPAYLTDLNDSSRSSVHRIEMWENGLEMVKYNPIFGIGRGGFQQYSGSLIAHNSGIQIMGETGMVGLFFWIGVIYFSLKNLMISIKKAASDSDKQVLMALFIAIVGYIISSMFVTLEYETFYVLLALAGAGARNLPLDEKPLIRKKDLKLIAAASLVFLLIVYVGVNIFKVAYG